MLDLQAEGLPDFMRGGYANAAGRTVTEKSALSNATFFRAVNLIASTIGMLPLNLHRRVGDKIEKADSHPIWRLLRVKPNRWQTPYQFKSYMQGRALLRGNAYAYKVPGVRGPQALAPLDPARIRPVLDDTDFTLAYEYQPKNGAQRIFKAEDIFHLRAPWSSDGICGDGLLKVAAEALGLAQVTDEAAARLLRNGAYVGGVLEHPKSLSPEAVLNLRAQFEERYVGTENAGRWVVAEEGMQVKPFGATGKDAEGLSQRKHQAEEVSRYTGVPRPLLMFDETSWGTGIEQLGLFLVTYCLLPWFNAWEETIADSLLTESERLSLYAKFNEAALLRGSLKDQAEFFAKALGGPGAGGFMVANEAREKMDMNPEAWGNTPAWMQGTADE
ncbi:phage portal protein [Novosphingobium guangzhouense]|uniref:Phage portal protein n=1 Tax=Novosphingobium guangzhouense TaxID=1850347 RepID=A0A2K2FUQ7_9SPHN|nr:phage portal protein [Novosphingobium guangzhouense]PNU02512.1 phage portal protein [Novosphingobium guangzhouense]